MPAKSVSNEHLSLKAVRGKSIVIRSLLFALRSPPADLSRPKETTTKNRFNGFRCETRLLVIQPISDTIFEMAIS